MYFQVRFHLNDFIEASFFTWNFLSNTLLPVEASTLPPLPRPSTSTDKPPLLPIPPAPPPYLGLYLGLSTVFVEFLPFSSACCLETFFARSNWKGNWRVKFSNYCSWRVRVVDPTDLPRDLVTGGFWTGSCGSTRISSTSSSWILNEVPMNNAIKPFGGGGGISSEMRGTFSGSLN